MKYWFLIIFLCFGSLCYAGTEEKPIDSQVKGELVRIVRDFEKDSTLDGFIFSRALDDDISYDDWAIHYKDDVYELRLKKGGNFSEEWTVNHTYKMAYRYYRFDEEDSENSDKVYSYKECLKTALEYLNKRGVSLLMCDFPGDIPERHDNEIWFRFENIKNKELKGFDNAREIGVAVNENTGKIKYFYINVRPIKYASLPFGISPQEACDTVKSFYSEKEIKLSRLEFASMGQGIERNRPVVIVAVSGIQSSEAGTGHGTIPGPDGEAVYEESEYAVLFFIDLYTKELVLVSPALNCSSIPKDAEEKIKEYENALKTDKPAPNLSEMPFEPLTDEILKTLTPTAKQIEFILYKDSEPQKAEMKEIDINKLQKGETSEIFTYKNEGRDYIFRAGSHWCFVNNKTVNLGGICRTDKEKIFLPKAFAEKCGL
ncbi:MAG: hypothetical protein KBT47_00485 [Armatimonadetes bacterium]|nr:hypothetical protein [Candidatus Hippobium faecium]